MEVTGKVLVNLENFQELSGPCKKAAEKKDGSNLTAKPWWKDLR